MSPLSRPEQQSGKIIWFLLTFAVAAVVSLSAGWAASMARTDERALAQIRELEVRVTQLERHYGEINTKLEFLVERARERK